MSPRKDRRADHPGDSQRISRASRLLGIRLAVSIADACERDEEHPVANPADRLIRAPFTLTERAVEAAVSGMLEDQIAERIVAELVRQGTLERVIDELVAAGLLEQIVEALVARGLVDRIVDDVIASGTVERVASSPEFRAAIAGASTGMADEMMGALRRRAVRADDRAEGLARRMLRRDDVTVTRQAATAAPAPAARATGAPAAPSPVEPSEGRTAGFVSRLTALLIDSAILIVAGVIAVAAAGMVANLFAKLSVSSLLGVLVATACGVAGICTYFVVCWWLAGQTVGMRTLALRVIGPGDRPPGFKRSVIRLGAAILGAIPLFAGYVIVLVDKKRLAFHDRVARTRVIYTS